MQVAIGLYTYNLFYTSVILSTHLDVIYLNIYCRKFI